LFFYFMIHSTGSPFIFVFRLTL